jgi:hypothetical protein
MKTTGFNALQLGRIGRFSNNFFSYAKRVSYNRKSAMLWWQAWKPRSIHNIDVFAAGQFAIIGAGQWPAAAHGNGAS